VASSARMKERAAGGRRGEFLFVVHIVAPDGGFGHCPNAVNPLRRRGSEIQHRWQPQRLAGSEFRSWCQEGLEIAKSLRHRFGGQIIPVTVQPIPRRRDAIAQIPATAGSELKQREDASRDERPLANQI
jgi:hypothetical protein